MNPHKMRINNDSSMSPLTLPSSIRTLAGRSNPELLCRPLLALLGGLSVREPHRAHVPLPVFSLNKCGSWKCVSYVGLDWLSIVYPLVCPSFG